MGVVDAGTEIFIVDDDPDVRRVLMEIFSSEGYRARAFATAELAWRAIELGAGPAAIVLDVWLPGMSGRQFVARLRGSAHAAIPVVVLSGSGWTESTECGGDDVLRKPVEGATVVHAVDRVVARNRGDNRPMPRAASRPGPGAQRLGGHRRI
jgi:DNA-binding response OmpR family regulator